MAELRREPIARRWIVILATETEGPRDFLVLKNLPKELEPIEPCPFCLGNESLTPGQILAIEEGGEGKWAVRVVPKKFPFFRNPTPPELAATHLREADSTWNYPSLYSRNGGI